MLIRLSLFFLYANISPYGLGRHTRPRAQFLPIRTDLSRKITFLFNFFLENEGNAYFATGRLSTEKVKPNTNKPTFLSSLSDYIKLRRLEVTILIIYAIMGSQGIYNVSDTWQLQSALRKGARLLLVCRKGRQKTNSSRMKTKLLSFCSKRVKSRKKKCFAKNLHRIQFSLLVRM